MKTTTLLLGLATAATAAELPLPKAPVRVVIPDVPAFDAALRGSYRTALRGEPAAEDRLVQAWRQSPVGTKLEQQWSLLAKQLPLTWDQILRQTPRSLGLSLLSVASLEAVLVIESPLAALPVTLPAGHAKAHAGIPYQLVAHGAGDASPDPDRRLGLAWARNGGRLFLATSERALLLALDEASGGRFVSAFLPGLASLDLDLAALRADRYFRREFLFGEGPEVGHITAALRLEGGHLVEVREGRGEPRPRGMTFDAPRAAAAGWEPDWAGLWPALRSALLDPIPSPADKPTTALTALPRAERQAAEDRYVVSFEKPALRAGPAAGEEDDLALWRSLWTKRPPPGWGYLLGVDGSRRLVFAWPAALQEDLERVCHATVERRAGRASVVQAGDAREIRVGPDLPALALARRGDFVWIAGQAADLQDAPTPRPAGDVVRWARVDLRAMRAEAPRWERAEGPASPERMRPFSDRILGLLGWMPATSSLWVERRHTADGGWTERIVFGGADK